MITLPHGITWKQPLTLTQSYRKLGERDDHGCYVFVTFHLIPLFEMKLLPQGLVIISLNSAVVARI